MLREADERLGFCRDLAGQLEDCRGKGVRHSLAKLLRTSIVLQALGWRDQDDADFLRDDAAVRSSVADERGTGSNMLSNPLITLKSIQGKKGFAHTCKVKPKGQLSTNGKGKKAILQKVPSAP